MEPTGILQDGFPPNILLLVHTTLVGKSLPENFAVLTKNT